MSDVVIEYLGIDELIPYENNPRDNSNGIAPVSESISRFKFRVPLLIDSKNVIIAGHTRYEAAKKLGINSIPCIRVSDLSEININELRIVDNKSHELSSWDMDKLEEELSYLRDANFESLDGMLKSDLFYKSSYGELGNRSIDEINDRYNSELKTKKSEEEICEFRFGKHSCMLTDSEKKRLDSAYKNYVEMNKVGYGFILELLKNGGVNYED